MPGLFFIILECTDKSISGRAKLFFNTNCLSQPFQKGGYREQRSASLYADTKLPTNRQCGLVRTRGYPLSSRILWPVVRHKKARSVATIRVDCHTEPTSYPMNIRANAMTHNTPFLFFLLGVFLSSGSYTENDSANPDAEPVPVTSETDAVETAPATVPPAPIRQPKLIGPTGATGTIRRSGRRQDRRLEEDLEDLGDALDRPRRGRR